VAKAKTRELWGYIATQQGDGGWMWETGGVFWRFDPNVKGQLTGLIPPEASSIYAYFPQLHDAMFYTFGFAAGVSHAAKVSEASKVK